MFPASRVETYVPPYGQTSSTPIFNVTSLAYEKNMNVYVKLNESINETCATVLFNGTNESIAGGLGTMITLKSAAKIVTSNLPISSESGIWSYTNVSCTGSKPFIIPLFCFFSMCEDCVITNDYSSTCEFYE